MTAPAPQILAGLLASFGRKRLVSDPILCHNLLNDLMPERPTDVRALVAVVESGVAARFDRRGGIRAAAARLAARPDLTPDEIAWAVSTWDTALHRLDYRPAVSPESPQMPDSSGGRRPPTVLIGAVIAVVLAAGLAVWGGLALAHGHRSHPAQFADGSFSPDGRFGYVTAGTPDQPGTLSVIDTRSNRIVHSVPVGRYPGDATVAPDGRHIYVPNNVDGTVTIIDALTYTVATIASVGDHPGDVVLTSDGRLGLVTNYSEDASTLTVFDTTTGRRVRTIPVGQNPSDVALTTDHRGFVTNYGDRTISVVDPTGQAPTRTVAVGINPSDAVVSSDHRSVYVTNDDAHGSVSVIDARSLALATISVGTNPEPIVLGDYGKAYVTNYRDGSVSVIDLAKHTVLRTLPVGNGPSAVTIDAGTDRGYVTNYQGDSVTAINIRTGAVIATTRVGSHPDGVYFSRNGALAYVHNHEDRSNAAPGSDPTVPQTVSRLDTGRHAVVGSIAIGRAVDYVIGAPDGAHLYVVHEDGTVAIVSLQ
jgi:YVTN family beta-propeller protein